MGPSGAHRTLLEWRAIARRKSCAPLLHRCRISRSVCGVTVGRLSEHHRDGHGMSLRLCTSVANPHRGVVRK